MRDLSLSLSHCELEKGLGEVKEEELEKRRPHMRSPSANLHSHQHDSLSWPALWLNETAYLETEFFEMLKLTHIPAHDCQTH